MTCQYRFISCNKCATMAGDVADEGGYMHMGRQGIYGNSVFFTRFSYGPKTALKNKVNNNNSSCARQSAGIVEWHFFSVPLYTLVQLRNGTQVHHSIRSQKRHSQLPRDFIYLRHLRFLPFLLKINLSCGLLDSSSANVYCSVITNLLKIQCS